MTLSELVERGDVEALLRRLAGLTEPQRRRLGVEFRSYLRTQDRWYWSSPAVCAIAVVAIGCQSSAAQAIALPNRADFAWNGAAIPAEPVVRAANERGIDWLGEFATGMVDKLDRDAGGWAFVADLLAASGAAVPVDADRFVYGWVRNAIWPSAERLRQVPTVDRLRADPLLDRLVPRLFEVEELGLLLTQPAGWDPGLGREPVFLLALAALAAEGRLDRRLLLDGCLARLLRGDRPGAVRAFVRLHDELKPTVEEAGARAADYLRLLATGPSQVALMAQRALRGAERSIVGVEFDALLDAGRAVLVRAELTLVRNQLAWLERMARDTPDRIDDVLSVVGVAFGHPELDIQERALVLAGKHTGAVSPATRSALRQAAETLSPALVTRAAELGTAPAAQPGYEPAHVEGTRKSAPMPPPIESVDELAEEVVALCAGEPTAVALERVLEALVRLSGTDRPQVQAALAPVLARHDQDLREQWWPPGGLRGALGAAVRVAAGTPVHDPWDQPFSLPRDAATHLPRVIPVGRFRPAPQRFLLYRVAEVALRLDYHAVPALVSTPTVQNGLIDPAVLRDRLLRAERDGWRPMKYDLAQALFRLPRDAAAQIDGPLPDCEAGQAFARWLGTGGLPAPEIRRVVVPGFDADDRDRNYSLDKRPERRVHVTLAPPGGYDDEFELLTLPAPLRARSSLSVRGQPTLWVAMFPAYPELVAAHALAEVATAADIDERDGAAVLPMLVDCSGPVGLATSIALAYGLAARHAADRVAAVDALLGFAGTGELDAPAVGRELGALAAEGMVKLGRAATALGDAARVGAGSTVWCVVASALPPLLSLSRAPTGLPDLLAVGADAAAAGSGTGIPAGLAELAARRGSGRAVVEARRLLRVLDRGETGVRGAPSS